ncbi:MAG: peptidoglycan DD-metalloendopeptidase family protein [Thermoanaerobaculia bacterium]|nr:peptidoglycan DD-metalloendopeptidase family protein [Thermoanaerobaculia bacterium]
MELRGEISQLEVELREARARSRSLAGRLQETELELELQDRRAREARISLEMAESRVAVSETAVEELDDRRQTLEASLRAHVLALYGLGRERYLRLLLAMDPQADVLAGVRQLRFLARRDAVALDEYREVERRLDRERAALEVEQARRVAWLDQVETRRAELEEARRRHRELAGEAMAKRRQLEARAASLRAREERLSRMIEIVATDVPESFQDEAIQGFKGVLDWPVAGEVVTDFGPRLDPRYRTEVPHNGIAIAAPAGAEVRPVYPGEVIFAAPFQGYGRTVVVKHAGGVLTLYAGLETLRVAKGDVVSFGSVLGAATVDLYFELRENNEAVDPLDWLR